jgi:hypothetical protein
MSIARPYLRGLNGGRCVRVAEALSERDHALTERAAEVDRLTGRIEQEQAGRAETEAQVTELTNRVQVLPRQIDVVPPLLHFLVTEIRNRATLFGRCESLFRLWWGGRHAV